MICTPSASLIVLPSPSELLLPRKGGIEQAFSLCQTIQGKSLFVPPALFP